MDQRERNTDMDEVIRTAMDALRASLWTAMPCLVEEYDDTKLTMTCQPTIKVSLRNSDGTFSWVPPPLLRDVPVVFPSGGGYAITWPLNQGDEVLVVFASRCIDGWWANGGVQLPSELRFNDLSDGFALPGPRSVPRSLAGVSATSLQIRSDDGNAYLELSPGGVVNIKAPGGVNIEGDVVITGTAVASGEGTFNSIPVSTHLHGGVSVGGSNTGVPIP